MIRSIPATLRRGTPGYPMDMFTGVSMRLKTMFMTIAAIGLLAGTAAAQEGTLKKIKDTGTITIGHRDASIPFSYYDDKQQVVGYAMDLCMQDRRRGQGRAQDRQARRQAAAGHLRHPHPADGERHHRPRVRLDHQQPRAPEAGLRSPSRTSSPPTASCRRSPSNLNKLDDLKGKTVVSTSGTTNIKQITEINAEQNLGMNIICRPRTTPRPS